MLVINFSESMGKMCHTLTTKTFTVWTHQTCYLMVRQRLCVKFTTGHTESKFYSQENSGTLALTSAGCQTQPYKSSSQRKGECTTRLSGQNETWYNILKLCHYKEPRLLMQTVIQMKMQTTTASVLVFVGFFG